MLCNLSIAIVSTSHKEIAAKTHAFVGHLILTHMDTQILCNFDRPFTSVCSSIALTSLFSPAHRSGYDTQVCSRQPAEVEMTLKFDQPAEADTTLIHSQSS